METFLSLQNDPFFSSLPLVGRGDPEGVGVGVWETLNLAEQ
jgi:hypothetical protein